MTDLILQQQILARLIRIEECVEFLCRNCASTSAMLNQIISDVGDAQGGIDTANSGISTLRVDVGTANQGIDDANAAIAAIDCGTCDLTEVNDKLDKIIKDIPKMKCRFPGGGPNETKTKKI